MAPHRVLAPPLLLEKSVGYVASAAAARAAERMSYFIDRFSCRAYVDTLLLVDYRREPPRVASF
jgi:hypothetical protein